MKEIREEVKQSWTAPEKVLSVLAHKVFKRQLTESIPSLPPIKYSTALISLSSFSPKSIIRLRGEKCVERVKARAPL